MNSAAVAPFTRAGSRAGAAGAAPLTPRVETWLQSIPLSPIGAILGPVAAGGGIAEWLGLATALAVMRLSGSDLASAVVAVAVVATTRARLG